MKRFSRLVYSIEIFCQLVQILLVRRSSSKPAFSNRSILAQFSENKVLHIFISRLSENMGTCYRMAISGMLREPMWQIEKRIRLSPACHFHVATVHNEVLKCQVAAVKIVAANFSCIETFNVELYVSLPFDFPG